MAQSAMQLESLALARRLVDAIEAGDANHADDLIKALHDGRFDALYQEIGKLTRDVHDTFANLAGEVNGVAVDDGAAHAGARLDTLDGHGEFSCWT